MNPTLVAVGVVLGLTEPYCSPVVCQGWPRPAGPVLLLMACRRPKGWDPIKGQRLSGRWVQTWGFSVASDCVWCIGTSL